jgi:hypothetical protein
VTKKPYNVPLELKYSANRDCDEASRMEITTVNNSRGRCDIGWCWGETVGMDNFGWSRLGAVNTARHGVLGGIAGSGI